MPQRSGITTALTEVPTELGRRRRYQGHGIRGMVPQTEAVRVFTANHSRGALEGREEENKGKKAATPNDELEIDGSPRFVAIHGVITDKEVEAVYTRLRGQAPKDTSGLGLNPRSTPWESDRFTHPDRKACHSPAEKQPSPPSNAPIGPRPENIHPLWLAETEKLGYEGSNSPLQSAQAPDECIEREIEEAQGNDRSPTLSPSTRGAAAQEEMEKFLKDIGEGSTKNAYDSRKQRTKKIEGYNNHPLILEYIRKRRPDDNRATSIMSKDNVFDGDAAHYRDPAHFRDACI